MSAHPTDDGAGAAGPPRLALALLRRLLHGPEGEALLGDLLEQHHARLGHGAPARRAAWRFWRESVAAILAARALRRRVPTVRTGDGAMRAFVADLRHGARLLRRAPLFTALCVLTLALGIGATTAIFAVVNPVLLRPLPYPAPERLALVWEYDPDGNTINTGWATFADLSRAARTLERSAAVAGWEVTITEGGEPEKLVGQRVSWTFFRTLGVHPALGRDFVAGDDVQGAHRVVVLSHGLWQRRFGGDSAVVGRAVPLDGVSHTVVGVLPAGFESVLDPDAQLWRVLAYDASLPYACRTCRHVRMLVRLRADVPPGAAAAELDALSAALVREHPKDYARAGTALVPLQAQVTGEVRPVLLVLLGAVALVLLMAAANVANLQLARAMRRDGEFAIRAALGAGRSRITRQLLAEGVLLAALGGLAGVVVAAVAVPALVGGFPDRLPRLASVRLDGAALLVCAGLTALLGVVVGLVPAWHGRRVPTFAALRDGARLTGGARQLARASIVTMEVALALMLLVGAGLLARSLSRLMANDPGFDPRPLVTVQVQASGSAYPENEDVWAHHDRLRAAVRALPGVVEVAHATQLPLTGNVDTYGIRAQDRPPVNPALSPHTDRYVVSPGFLQTMGIALRRGRAFTDADNVTAAPPVIILSEALAAALWPGEDPIGRRVQMGGTDRPWRTVIGIAGNVRHGGLDAEVTQQAYVPERQWPWADGAVTLVVRTDGEPAALAGALRRAVQSVDPTQPVGRVATMREIVATSVAQRRLALVLFVAFAATAVLMACAGIYGVLAGSVTERTREIGLRTALGAPPRAIFGLVLAQAARLVVLGLALGLVGALALGRFLGSLLYGVRPGDPGTLAAVAALLAGVALVACLAPVRRALRVDPMAALRAD